MATSLHFFKLTVLLSMMVLAACVALLILGSQRAEAALPGKNGKIAFFGFEARSFDIYTTKPGSTGLTNLTKSSRISETDPAWSPNGKKIAFSHSGDIFVMKANGTGLKKFTRGPAGRFAGDFSPSWSPDGKKIAFARYYARGADADIYTIRANGTQLRQLTNVKGFEEDPAWSPDGRKIAFVRGAVIEAGSPVDQEIYVMNVNGSVMKNITRTPREQESSPDWSPDGKRLAFERDESIFIMNASGRNVKRLTRGQNFSFDPAFSPDGKKIAFVREDGIFTMNTNGTRVKRVAGGFVEAGSPSWQPLPKTRPTPTGRRASCKITGLPDTLRGTRAASQLCGLEGRIRSRVNRALRAVPDPEVLEKRIQSRVNLTINPPKSLRQ